jgi:hypothetical protein
MLPEIKYLPVNWIDGMKISAVHFNQLESSIVDRVRDTSALALTNFNYGLLAPMPGNKTSLTLQVSKDQSGLIRIKLTECRAITAAGVRIEISGEGYSKLNTFETTISAKTDEDIFIVIAVNPFERVPFGQPKAEESPVRYPFGIPAFHLEAKPASQLNVGLKPAYHLVIGKLKSAFGELTLDTNFIPPSTSINSHAKLKEEYNNLGDLLGQIGNYSTVIVQKVRFEKQKTDLAINIMYVAEKIIFFLADKIAKYRWTVAEMPPVYMIETFLSLAYLTKSTFDCVTEKEREQMFTYFEQWTELTPAQFQNRLNAVIEIDYNHQDIATAIQEVKTFTAIMVKLFNQMSKLKYIGDQQDRNIVIGETIEQKKPEAKRGWSFLND